MLLCRVFLKLFATLMLVALTACTEPARNHHYRFTGEFEQVPNHIRELLSERIS